MGVGISWEYGNRVFPGRHRIRLAGMQRGRAQDFQSYSLDRVGGRNCLMWMSMVTRASCAGVCWHDQECA